MLGAFGGFVVGLLYVVGIFLLNGAGMVWLITPPEFTVAEKKIITIIFALGGALSLLSGFSLRQLLNRFIPPP
jgi:hypothetical protein